MSEAYPGGRLQVRAGQFVRDGFPHQILSGAIHYFRVHPDLWHDRLLRLRAMGLNTIETYLAWNFHEIDGQLDFTGPRNVARFLTEAGDLGFDVIVRPGPYICAEWDLGGLPSSLLRDPSMALRTVHEEFLSQASRWLDACCAVIRPHLSSNGGPVVMVQVENEYGSFGDDAAYLTWCREALIKRGVDVLLCTSDGAGADWLANGTIPGTLATGNFGSRVADNLAELRVFQPEGPDLCMEFWNGWFDHWGEAHHVRAADHAAENLSALLDRGASVNIYLAHGGTNFGLWNGANVVDGKLAPTVTSYDYDAPVGEAGELREKYYAYREILGKYHSDIPEPPDALPRLRPQRIECSAWARLTDHLDRFRAHGPTPHPLRMDQVGSGRGLIVYTGTGIVPPDGRQLYLDELGDRATVLADGEFVGLLDGAEPSGLPLQAPVEEGPTEFTVIVENLGSINYGPWMGRRKGVASVRINNRFLHGWRTRALELDDPTFLDQISFGPSHLSTTTGPVLARAGLQIDAPADGFLALPEWQKGFVWLNGHMLGRYWSRGPQVTLYAPGPWWRAGENELVVLELERAGRQIELRDVPDLGRPVEAADPG